jgi:undecaprenyl pyrophosphate phosphatase UppP
VGIKKSLDLLALDEPVSLVPLVVGAGVATVTAFLVIHFFLKFIRKYTLWPFVWYSLILSGFIGYVAFIT